MREPRSLSSLRFLVDSLLLGDLMESMIFTLSPFPRQGTLNTMKGSFISSAWVITRKIKKKAARQSHNLKVVSSILTQGNVLHSV